jgi:cell division protein FtsI/penicillin-binding protein 2
MNSCNPVFIGLGQKLGVRTYYSYLEKFRFTSEKQE